MLRIHTNDDPILRTICEPVKVANAAVFKLASQMHVTMKQRDAIGLAANQVGYLYRIITINTTQGDKDNGIELTLINPEVIEKTDLSTSTPEGCLSLPDQLAIVPRHMRIKVKYMNIFGKETVREFVNLTAICIQHEIDHLNGVLMTDYQKTAQDQAQPQETQPQAE